MSAITKLNPKLLRWARERAGLDQSQLARKVIGPTGTAAQVVEWERTGELTFRRAELVAEKTYTPFGYLFLQEPPEEQLPIKDFRTVGGVTLKKPSPEMLDVVYECQRRQAWYRDYLISQGAASLPFIGKFNQQNQIEEVAGSIRDTLGIGPALSKTADTWQQSLTLHIEQVEEAGILVMRNSIVGNNPHRKLSIKEFRGFALCDNYAPVVFINARDAKAAQIFTLVHELTHIWLGESAVSNPSLKRTNATEQFCNAVAAEVLVPFSEIRWQWIRGNDHDKEIAKFARHLKVSTLVIARRARQLDFITETQLDRFYKQQEERYLKLETRPREPDEQGGQFHNSLSARASDRFCRALVASTFEGKTGYTEAFRLLGLKSTESLRSFAKAKYGYLAAA